MHAADAVAAETSSQLGQADRRSIGQTQKYPPDLSDRVMAIRFDHGIGEGQRPGRPACAVGEHEIDGFDVPIRPAVDE